MDVLYFLLDKVRSNKTLPSKHTKHFVASELKDPIWHSLEWQIGSRGDDLYNICTMLDQRGIRWADIVEMLFK